jgi:hypothetical protein
MVHTHLWARILAVEILICMPGDSGSGEGLLWAALWNGILAVIPVGTLHELERSRFALFCDFLGILIMNGVCSVLRPHRAY